MREAALHLIGEHDFRNFCKMDVVNSTSFVRTIDSISIEECGRYEDVVVRIGCIMLRSKGVHFCGIKLDV